MRRASEKATNAASAQQAARVQELQDTMLIIAVLLAVFLVILPVIFPPLAQQMRKQKPTDAAAAARSTSRARQARPNSSFDCRAPMRPLI